MLIGITETCSKRKLILIKNPTYDNYCPNIIHTSTLSWKKYSEVVQVLNMIWYINYICKYSN